MSRKEAHYFEPGDAITLTNCANLLHNGNFFITAISDASSSSKCRADWCSTFHSVRQMFKFGTGVFIGSFDSSEKCLEACENAIGATGCHYNDLGNCQFTRRDPPEVVHYGNTFHTSDKVAFCGMKRTRIPLGLIDLANSITTISECQSL